MRTSACGHRLFFALQPDPVSNTRIDRLMPRLLRCWPTLDRPMAPLRRHVSLNGLSVDRPGKADIFARASDAVACVRHPPFVVAFNRIAMFGKGQGSRPAVLRGDEGVLGVELLRSEIQSALADAGLAPRREEPFEAHLTLARGACNGAELIIAPITWTVREFVLIHSHVGETRYELVGSFPLRCAP